MIVDAVRDGRIYVRGGVKSGWKAQITVVGFGEDSRWWLTGVEWGWRVKEKGVDDPGGAKRGFSKEERQQILDLANMEILPTRRVEKVEGARTASVTNKAVSGAQGDGSKTGTPGGGTKVNREDGSGVDQEGKVDSPLVRVYNFLGTHYLENRWRYQLMEGQSTSHCRISSRCCVRRR